MHFVHSCGAQRLANEKPWLSRHAAERHVQQQEATRAISAGPRAAEPQRGLRKPPRGWARR
eukprot:6786922-Pyramimonas_sp.AAC.1